MVSSLNTTTCLLICGESLNFNFITETLNFLPTSVTRKGEVILPSIREGGARDYDSRLGLDCWKLGLTSKQSRFDIGKQLDFWIEKLYPVRSAFQDFNKLGYWSVIDCQIGSYERQLPSIQFRLTKETQLKLAKICIDIDFTISRPVEKA